MPELTDESSTGDPGQSTDLRVAKAWLDALTSGACDESAFLKGLPTFSREAPDTGWDLLSLVDQYYRRGKIHSASFLHLKSQLQMRLLRPGFDADISVPLPQGAASHPAADRTVPIRMPTPNSAPETISQSPPMAAPQLAAVRRDARTIAVGDVLRGRYRITGILGQGGMGTVLAAVDQYRLDLPDAAQRVAIKVLHAAISERPELLAELRREFHNLQSLSHPNIVRVHEYDQDGDTAFFTMEYLSGRTLAHALSAHQSEGLDRSQAFSIIHDVRAALAYAHSRRVVHGDLNPGNIFITDAGEVRVLDFGASHRLRRGSQIAQLDAAAQTPVATPRYASCQLLEGQAADVRDDVFAFACIIYVMLAAQHPFGERTALEARALALCPARPERITEEQWHALRSGLAFDRDSRPSSLDEWLAPFDSPAGVPAVPVLLHSVPVSQQSTPVSRRRYLLPAVSAAVAAVVMALWWSMADYESAGGAGGPLTMQPRAAAASGAAMPGAGTGAADAGHRDAPAVEAAADSAPEAAPPSTPAPTLAPAPSSEPAPEVSAAGPASASLPPAQPVPPPAAVSIPVRKPPPGRARIELATGAVEVPPGDPMAHVVVRRSGDLQARSGFTWWTESGTAKPGADFEPVAGHQEQFEPGKSSVNLFVPIVSDSTRRRSKSFYVMIGDPADGASLGARNLTMVTVEPRE